MTNILTKFVVCSLPRTGTKSMAQMLKTLGFGVQHAPGPTYKAFAETRYDTDALADTPMYQPTVIEWLMEGSDDVKFIYVEKDAQAWVDSMLKVGLHQSFELNAHLMRQGEASEHNEIDYHALREVLGEDVFDAQAALQAFENHKVIVETIVPPERLLTYSFAQGWEPLCEFVGKEVPDSDVPHLNKDSMFDPLT